MVEFPASDTYVMGAGGTTILVDSSYNVIKTTAWDAGGGGFSLWEYSGGWQTPFVPVDAGSSVVAIGKGGADVMIKAMLGLLNELGADLHLNSEVARIAVASGRATGIALVDGQKALWTVRPRVERAAPACASAHACEKSARGREGRARSSVHWDRCSDRMRESKTLAGKRTRKAAAARLASSVRPSPDSAWTRNASRSSASSPFGKRRSCSARMASADEKSPLATAARAGCRTLSSSA